MFNYILFILLYELTISSFIFFKKLLKSFIEPNEPIYLFILFNNILFKLNNKDTIEYNMLLGKKNVFRLIIVLIIISFYLFLDVLLSRSFLFNKENCYNFEKYYYDLKKNCTGKDQFKSSFPTVNIYTDELGLRTKNKYSKHDLAINNTI